MRRKLLVGALVGAMMLSAVGCGKDNGGSGVGGKDVAPVTEAATKATTEEETEAKTTEEDKTEEVTTEESSKNENDSSIIADFASGDVSGSKKYRDAYQTLIDTYYAIVAERSDDVYYDSQDTGVVEAARNLDMETALSTIGYAITDTNGDGVEEFIIGYINDETTSTGTQIYVIYTYDGDYVLPLMSGWARNSLSFLDDGTLYQNASSGAAYTYISNYEIDTSIYAYKYLDFYYTDIDDNGNVLIFNNKNGDTSKKSSDKFKGTLDDLWDIADGYQNRIAAVKLIPFADATITPGYYIPTQNSPGNDMIDSTGLFGTGTLVCGYENDMASQYGLTSYEFCYVNDSPYCENVAFVAQGDVRDIKILKLDAVNFNDDGSIDYNISEYASWDILTDGEAIVIRLEFPEIIPNCGISYDDGSGVLRRYTISQSGEDGSVVLSEF